MENIVFESEIYGMEAVGGIFPFQIKIKESEKDGFRKVEVVRVDYKPKGNDVIEEENQLTMSIWKEN